eukprot:tig00021094_g18114.t1
MPRQPSPRARVGLTAAAAAGAVDIQKRFPPLDAGIKSIETWPSTREEVSSTAQKPALLVQIEDEIENELAALGGAADPVSRLNVFRKALATYTRSMKSYAPLLTRIHAEFERALAETTRALDEVLPLKSRLSLIELEHQKEILRIQREYDERIAVLEKAMRRGKAARLKIQEEKSQLAARAARLEKEAKEAKAEYREQYETNRSLVSNMRHHVDLLTQAQQDAAALPDLQERLRATEAELRDVRQALAIAEAAGRDAKAALHSLRSASRVVAGLAPGAADTGDTSRASSRSAMRSESPGPDISATPLLNAASVRIGGGGMSAVTPCGSVTNLHSASGSGLPAPAAPAPLPHGAGMHTLGGITPRGSFTNLQLKEVQLHPPAALPPAAAPAGAS